MARKKEETAESSVDEKVEVTKKSSKSSKSSKKDKTADKIKSLESEIAELKDKNLRLFAEFDNFRKRAAKERVDYLKSAGRDIFEDLLPVMDDFDRGNKLISEAKDIEALKTGMDLMYAKLKNTLQTKGLKPMVTINEIFDADKHEAITEIPAPSEDLKGKVIDEVEKGYTLNDIIIRFPKVVVGK